MRIILVVLSATLKTCIALRCFHCEEHDTASCEKLQKSKTCPQYLKRPFCLTVSYNETIDETNIVQTVAKKCSTQEYTCEEHCSRLWSNCKPDCCTTDDCNKQRFKQKPVEKYGSKRSISDGSTKNNSINNNGTGMSLMLLMIISFSIIWKCHE